MEFFLVRLGLVLRIKFTNEGLDSRFHYLLFFIDFSNRNMWLAAEEGTYIHLT